MMTPTAYLINMARGALVDEAALADTLRVHRIAGAGIDAFREQPPVGSPLLSLENIVLTPHPTGMDETAEAPCATAASNRFSRSQTEGLPG
jgi:phosphoglycerate dehydrogenase-like enzyme